MIAYLDWSTALVNLIVQKKIDVNIKLKSNHIPPMDFFNHKSYKDFECDTCENPLLESLTEQFLQGNIPLSHLLDLDGDLTSKNLMIEPLC